MAGSSLVLDNGCHSIKAGLSCDEEPNVTQTLVGLPKVYSVPAHSAVSGRQVARGRRLDSGNTSHYIGEQAFGRRKILTLKVRVIA